MKYSHVKTVAVRMIVAVRIELGRSLVVFLGRSQFRHQNQTRQIRYDTQGDENCRVGRVEPQLSFSRAPWGLVLTAL